MSPAWPRLAFGVGSSRDQRVCAAIEARRERCSGVSTAGVSRHAEIAVRMGRPPAHWQPRRGYGARPASGILLDVGDVHRVHPRREECVEETARGFLTEWDVLA